MLNYKSTFSLFFLYSHCYSTSYALTLVMLCAKRGVHNDRIKFLCKRHCFKTTHIALDHVNVWEFELFNISFKYVNCVFVDFKTNT